MHVLIPDGMGRHKLSPCMQTEVAFCTQGLWVATLLQPPFYHLSLTLVIYQLICCFDFLLQYVRPISTGEVNFDKV
jgi:hypothetical protein